MIRVTSSRKGCIETYKDELTSHTYQIEKIYIHSFHFGLVGVSGGVGYASLPERTRSEGRFLAEGFIEPFWPTKMVPTCFTESVSSRSAIKFLPVVFSGEQKGLLAFHSGDRRLSDRGSALNRLM